MKFNICLLAHRYNYAFGELCLSWFETTCTGHQYTLTTTIDETIALKPHLVVVILLKVHGESWEPCEQRHVDIRDIAKHINHLNVMCFKVKWVDPLDYSSLIPDDIKNDPNDYTELYKSLMVFPGRYYNEEIIINQGSSYTPFEPIYLFATLNKYVTWSNKRKSLAIYLMLALTCNIVITEAVIHHFPKSLR